MPVRNDSEEVKQEIVKRLKGLIRDIQAGKIDRLEVSANAEFVEDFGRYGGLIERVPSGWQSITIRYYKEPERNK